MSDHIDRVHLVNTIARLDKRLELIERSALDELDVEILTLRLVKFKTFGYIADTVGLSLSQVGRRYKKALITVTKTMEGD